MTDKSYVTLAQHQCLICGTCFDTGEILMHNRLKPVFEKHTVTGMGVCPEHQAILDDGYIAAVVVTNEGSAGSVFLKKEYAEKVFSQSLGDSQIVRITPEVLALLTDLAETLH